MQRSFKSVPLSVFLVLALSLVAQLAWKTSRVPTAPEAGDFPPPPGMALLQLASLGDPVPLAKLSMLYLQTFDSQVGNVAAYKKLNYEHLEGWLKLILELDPDGQYPLFVATRFYAEVPDKAKRQRMMDFVFREFFKDPERRWPSLAYQTLVVQHQLKDLPLAQTYAHAIYLHTNGEDVPLWVKLLEPAILEEMGELDKSRAMLQESMARGLVKSPDDMRAFQNHLKWIDRQLAGKN